MPIIPCETCRKDVADSALDCPHCGAELPAGRYARSGAKTVMCRGCYVHNAYCAHSTDVRCRACGKDLAPEFARRLRKDGAWGWGVAGGFAGFLAGTAVCYAWVGQVPLPALVPFVALGWWAAYSAALPGD